MNTTVSGDTKLPDSRTYRTFSLDGMWKDSLGDIGTIKGFGKVESLSGEPNLRSWEFKPMKMGISYGLFIEEIVLMFKLEEVNFNVFGWNR